MRDKSEAPLLRMRVLKHFNHGQTVVTNKPKLIKFHAPEHKKVL